MSEGYLSHCELAVSRIRLLTPKRNKKARMRNKQMSAGLRECEGNGGRVLRGRTLPSRLAWRLRV